MKSRTKLDENMERFANFEMELRIRGYSRNSIDVYLYYNGKFLDFVQKSPREVRSDDIRDFLDFLVRGGKKPRTVNMALNSLKAYYEGFLRKSLFKYIKRQKTPRDLPRILSQSEVKAMILGTENPKHRLLIELLYSSGLRVGECVRLKINDVDISEKMIFIDSGKGKKDRHVITSKRFIDDFDYYIRNRDNESGYIFESPRGGHITIRAAEEIVRSSAKMAGIRKNVYPHLFRASFATHLIEDDVSIYKVQKLLGHSEVRTTEGYIGSTTVDIKSVRSPMDDVLGIKQKI